MPTSNRRPLHELKVRTCRTMHRCCVCLENIEYGDRYHDGGWPRRAHVACAEAARLTPKLEYTRKQLDDLDRARHAAARKRAVPVRSVPCRTESFLDGDP